MGSCDKEDGGWKALEILCLPTQIDLVRIIYEEFLNDSL